jgi:probable addiction module antidote protein
MGAVRKHDEWLAEKLKDAAFAAEYLTAAAEDDDAATYLAALRKVAEASGGMSHMAEQTGLSRETLYRTLSNRGNPTVKTLIAILRASGLKLSFSAKT